MRDGLGCCLLPVFRVSEMAGQKKVAFEAAGFEPAEQARENAGVGIQAFPEGPFFKPGERTREVFAEK